MEISVDRGSFHQTSTVSGIKRPMPLKFHDKNPVKYSDTVPHELFNIFIVLLAHTILLKSNSVTTFFLIRVRDIYEIYKTTL